MTALHAALRATPPAEADSATVALAKRYALELDDAAVISQRLSKTLRKALPVLMAADPGGGLYDELMTLAVRIEETHVAATIGPKLLAALESLQLTPRARIGVLREGGASRDPVKSALDELRDRRQSRAAAVDPSA